MDRSADNTDALANSDAKDQRLFDRFPSRFPAKFKDTRNDFGTDVYLRDASAGGIKIATKERLYLNDHVALQVQLPDGKDVMELRGEVVWAKHRDDQMWNAGVKFHKIVFMEQWRSYQFFEDEPAS